MCSIWRLSICFGCFPFSRDIYLLRTSNRFLAWPWSSLTAWRFGRRMTWRRQRACFRQVEWGDTTTPIASQQASIRPISSEEASNGPDASLNICIHHHDNPDFPSCKTPRHPPVPPRGGASCWNIFCDVKASSVAFCMQYGPKSPDWRPHEGGHGAAFCMAYVDAPHLPHRGASASSPYSVFFFSLFQSNSTFSPNGKD